MFHNCFIVFQCHLCERCFGQQTNLDRHLKKHEFESVRSTQDKPDSSASPEHSSTTDTILPKTEMAEITFHNNILSLSKSNNESHCDSRNRSTADEEENISSATNVVLSH